MARRLSWLQNANCKDVPTDVFFPHHSDYKTAKRICESCSVRQDCLQYAISYESDLYGMFGGMTPAERYEYANKLKAGKYRE